MSKRTNTVHNTISALVSAIKSGESFSPTLETAVKIARDRLDELEQLEDDIAENERMEKNPIGPDGLPIWGPGLG